MNKNDPPKRGLTTGNLLDFYAQQTGKIPGSPQLRRVSSNEEANVHLIRSEVEENQSSDNLIKSAQENSTKEEIFVLHQRENELQEILLKIEGNVPTNNIFNLLYEWLISYSNYSSEEEIQKHLDWFYIYFSILNKKPVKEQAEELKNFCKWITLHGVKIYTCKAGWIKRLIEEIFPLFLDPSVHPEEVEPLLIQGVNVISRLGSFNINTCELKGIFRFLFNTKEKHRIWPLFFDSLKTMASVSEIGPDSYFHFSGSSDCGIAIPGIVKWPQNGYSFCAWVRVESFSHPYIKPYNPHIFSFLSDDGSGIEFFFYKSSLCIRIDVKGKRTSQELKFPLQSQSWYFICLCHEYHFIGRSELRLYINKQKITIPLTYPKFTEPLSVCCIGTNGKVNGKYLSDRSHPLFGQMGAFFFFQESLSDAEIKFLYEMNPSTLNKFSPNSLPDSKLGSKLFYSFSPKGSYETSCFNVSSKEKGKLPRGIRVVKLKTIHKSIPYIGGVNILFYLLNHIDLPADTPNRAQAISHFVSQLFALLSELLRANPTNQQNMIDNRGFEIIGYILQQLPPDIFTKEIIANLFLIANSISENEALEKDLFLSIFLDFRIWIYASVEVQQELLRLLKSHTLTKLPYYLEMIGTQILLDVCRNFYWFKPDEHSFAVEPKFNLASSVSSITISQDDGEEVQSNNHQRPSEKHIKILRHQILEIFFEFVKESITFDETKSIVLYLQECQDERQLANLLQIILSLQKTSQHIILKHLIALGGLEPFIALLNANNENVRLWSLKVIGKMLEQSHPKQKEQLLSGSITTVAIKKCLQQYKMTPATYFTLLEVLLENVSITALKNPLEGLDKDTALQFKNPGIISTIFELLCLTGGSDLQLRVLKEFENLLRQSSHNRTIFLEQHWQSWLFGLLANYTGGGLSTTPLKLRSDIFNSIIEIFTISHYHSISQIDGWDTFIQTETLLHYFAERGYFDPVKILRSLYTAFLHKIQMDGSLLQSNDFRIWDSMCKWVSQVEDYLFSNANQDSFEILRIHKDNNGRWADYPLAQTLSEFLDRLIAKSSQVNSPNSSSNNSIQRQVEQFTKLQLNLILASMREADSFISQEKGQLQSEQFDILQKFVSSEKARIKDAVSMFIKAKQNQQTAESQQLSSFLQKNLTKLQRIIDQLLENASESNLNRVLFVTSFLYKTMESSHQQSGVGSDQMFAIFRYILPKIKPENMNFASEEELISYFMNGFTYSDSSFVMTNQFENALKMIFEEQQELFNRRKTRIEQNQKLTLSRIEQEMEKENSSHKKFKHSFELLHDSYCKEERSRRQNFVESLFQSTKSVSSRWSRLKRFLQSDRGPFTNSDLPYQFTLDNTEDLLRRRKLLARTFKKIDHSNAAIEKFRTKILATSLNETSIINEKKQQELIESNNSETDVNIEEIPLHKIVFQIPCELIRPMKVTPGTLQMTSTNLYFLSQRGDKKQWSLEQVIKLYSRRYVLQWTAFEIFLQNHKNYFFNFQTKKEAEATMKKLLSLCYNITETCSFDKHPKSLLSKLKLTELWQQKKISNFEYLMFLNTLSGRTYNDFAQYPIFPWILTDYSSPTLDLSNPAIYRDLSKPIGALSPSRLQQLKERYDSFQDPLIPKFLYGTHYSSPGIILFYLVRLEPFCTHFLTLQGGYFDIPERMFVSIKTAWENCLTAPADVKELIPEFFYLPEFLENLHGYDLGTKQDGTKLSNVVLPPWADGDPIKFIRLHREALESDYVSQHLHEWIDLIFGSKQQGKEAEEANNVFYHWTYEGVDINSITDPHQKKSTIDQIQNFGQTPVQLFTKPHPSRTSGRRESRAPLPSAHLIENAPYSYNLKPRAFAQGGIPIVFIEQIDLHNLFVLYSDGLYGISRWSSSPDSRGFPFTLELDKSLSSPKPKQMELQFSEEINYRIAPFCFGFIGENKYLLHTGCWDDTIRLTNLQSGQILFSISEHEDLVTCLDVGADGITVVSGSSDTSLRVWEYNEGRGRRNSLRSSPTVLENFLVKKKPPLRLKRILIGHEDRINCVAVSTEMGIVLSGSQDKTCMQYTLEGKYLRSLYFNSPVTLVHISTNGELIIYCAELAQLYLYHTNGKHLRTISGAKKLTQLKSTRDAKYLVTGDSSGTVFVRKIEDLSTIHQFESSGSDITSLAFIYDETQVERYLVAGFKEGQLTIFVFSPLSWIEKQKDKETKN